MSVNTLGIIKRACIIFAFALAFICTGILKERWQKMDDLTKEYNRIENIYSSILKNTKDECFSKKGADDSNKDKKKTTAIEATAKSGKYTKETACNTYSEATYSLEQTKAQMIMINKIENTGASFSVCGSISSIASGSPGFESACYKIDKCISNNGKNCITDSPETHDVIYNNIKDNFRYFYIDLLPSEILYFILAMSSSLIGALCKFRLSDKYTYDLQYFDLIIYLSYGFIGYTVATGAKYVIALNNQQLVSNINPYSIALMGCIVGMYFHNVIKLNPAPALTVTQTTSQNNG